MVAIMTPLQATLVPQSLAFSHDDAVHICRLATTGGCPAKRIVIDLARAQEASPLARTLVILRARVLGMTRLEFARRSGISRGTLRDLELGIHTPTRRVLRQFVDFCAGRKVAAEHLEALRRLYAGVMQHQELAWERIGP